MTRIFFFQIANRNQRGQNRQKIITWPILPTFLEKCSKSPENLGPISQSNPVFLVLLHFYSKKILLDNDLFISLKKAKKFLASIGKALQTLILNLLLT